MGSVTIHYDTLGRTANVALNTARELGDYSERLSREVANSFGGIHGGSNSNTGNSEYYVRQKIQALNKKQTAYNNFANNLNGFASKARETDERVGNKISAEKDAFINKHEYAQHGLSSAIIEWFMDLEDSCPIFKEIGDCLRRIGDTLEVMRDTLRQWYYCGGGKELIDMFVDVAYVVVCALALAVAIGVAIASGGAALAVLGIVGAGITLANSGMALFEDGEAFKSTINGDPGWARVYGDRNSWQDWLRTTNFGDGKWNDFSEKFATTLDFSQIICVIAGLANAVLNPSSLSGAASAFKHFVDYGKDGVKILKGFNSIISGDKKIMEAITITAIGTIDEFDFLDKLNDIMENFSDIFEDLHLEKLQEAIKTNHFPIPIRA